MLEPAESSTPVSLLATLGFAACGLLLLVVNGRNLFPSSMGGRAQGQPVLRASKARGVQGARELTMKPWPNRRRALEGIESWPVQQNSREAVFYLLRAARAA